MLKKILSFNTMIITLFYFNIGLVIAYEFEDPSRESNINSRINDIYMMKKQFEDLAGEAEDSELEIIDSYNASYWWPIGSVETQEKDGKLFAIGDPETTLVTSAFGTRNDPISGVVKVHRGTDIGGTTYGQTNVIAAKDGIVVHPTSLEGNNCPDNTKYPGVCSDYGNYVKIQHADGNYTVYGHLYANSITVKAGEYVKQGQVVGKVGSSGYSKGAHLHFEIRIGADSYSASQPTVGVYIFQDNPRPAATSVVEGSDTKQTACLTLHNSGYPDSGVAALLTNMYYESSFIANNLEGIYEKSLGYTDETYTQAVDDGTYTNFVHDKAGYGIVQWTYWDLKQDLYNYVKSKNASIGDIGAQLELLVKQLQEKFPEVNSYLMNSSNTSELSTNYFCLNYENPANANANCMNRTKYSSEYETYVKNGCK